MNEITKDRMGYLSGFALKINYDLRSYRRELVV